MTGWAHIPVLVQGGVHLLVFPWSKTSFHGIFRFISQFPKTIYVNYYIIGNNLLGELKKLFVCRSILQPTFYIVSLAVDAEKIAQCSMHAAIL